MTAAPSQRRPRILCVSFSPIFEDARVLRQIAVLREHGDVVTVGYGPKPSGAAAHIEVPSDAVSLPRTPLGVAKLALRAHRSVELTAPGEVAVKRFVKDRGPYDLVVANDARALPLAFHAAGGAPVWADMHEWAPHETASLLSWRILVAPYMEYLCRTYLPSTSAVTTVSAGLAELYHQHFGVETGVVRSAPPFHDLAPKPVQGGVIRLVHSGIADTRRNLPTLIEAIDKLGEGFTLDLFLVEVPGGHLDALKGMAATRPGVTVHDPVPPATLPNVLNDFDLGVFLFPIKTLSQRHHLPNKFFDFVQARLGLVFSSAPEIEAHIGKYGLGVITADTSADALVDSLQRLTPDDVMRFKNAAHEAAHALSNESDSAFQHALIERLLVDRK